MPVYTYRCDKCGIQFDKRQSFSDDPLTVCPECEQETLHKVYQPVGIVFKGKGFYATDHRSSSRATKAPEKKTETKSESKPAAASKETKSPAASTVQPK